MDGETFFGKKMNYEELAGILRLYDVQVDLGAVKAAFEAEQPSPGLADWARLHLTPDTLLTVDDLLQWVPITHTSSSFGS